MRRLRTARHFVADGALPCGSTRVLRRRVRWLITHEISRRRLEPRNADRESGRNPSPPVQA